GAEAIDVACSDHEEVLPDVPFPTTIELTVPSQKTRVKLRYTKLDANPPWDRSDFVLEAPPGAKIMESG
ncbi:MAG TPA: hypothetical protein VGD74_05130, partial [Vulgatibacter sp.]